MKKNNTALGAIRHKKTFFAAAVCIILTCMGIFLFSSQDGSESSGLSTEVTRIISGIIFRRFGSMTAEEQSFIVTQLNPFVRKLAHFTEYALLGGAIYSLILSADTMHIRKKRLAALIAAAAFASLDELHQLLVPARSGKLIDVLIDSCGAAAGILAVTVIVIVVKYIREELARRREHYANSSQ
ncbi:MAG: VanZ family protein [Oscillospiraceae bacterium]